MDRLVGRIEELTTAPPSDAEVAEPPADEVEERDSSVEPEPNGTPEERGPESDPSSLPEGIVPYVRAPSRSLGGYDDLVDGDPARLAEPLQELVHVEGPIHREEAQRVILSWHDARSTAKSREAFDRAVEHAIAQGVAALDEGAFLWPPERGDVVIRHRGGDDAVDDPDHIADEEYRAVVLWVAQREMGSRADDLVTSAARVLGYARTTTRLASRLGAVVAALREREELTEDPAGFLTVAG